MQALMSEAKLVLDSQPGHFLFIYYFFSPFSFIFDEVRFFFQKNWYH